MKREISIHPSITGIERFISLRERVKTVVKPDPDSYIVGGQEVLSTSLEDILSAFDLKLPQLIDDPYVLAYTKWLGSSEVDWSKALGTKNFVAALAKYKREIVELVESIEETGYADTLIKGRKILELLQGVHVNEKRVRTLIEEGHPMQSFLPQFGKECAKVKYTHSSKTGRLKVVDGPRVLTVAKQNRDVIVSRYPGGKILSADFTCLEPRVALLAIGKKPEADVYEEMSRKMDQSRAKAKLATLSFLYGAGASGSIDAKAKEQVKEHFQVNKLREIILSNNGANAFGRPLHVEDERNLISHWVQSTAVDICLLGFSELATKLKDYADPLFMIHDDVFFDVPSENLQLVSDVMSKGVNVSPFGHFPVSLKECS
jgi:hypothetical protein